jgi:pyruvate carboxylase subunit B
MKYQVTVNGRSYAVELDALRVTVDGVEHRATLAQGSGTPERLLTLDGRPYALPMWSGGRGSWTVLEAGERFEVEALDERTAHIRSLAKEVGGPASPMALRAPMPGLVLQVLATQGQKVAAGTSLIVLEAMKMQNELKAPAAAVVESVTVAPGSAVEKGEVLLTFRAVP